jgi:hypothetical protein
LFLDRVLGGDRRARRGRVAQGELAEAGGVDRQGEEAHRLLVGVEAHRVLGLHEVEEELGAAVVLAGGGGLSTSPSQSWRTARPVKQI